MSIQMLLFNCPRCFLCFLVLLFCLFQHFYPYRSSIRMMLCHCPVGPPYLLYIHLISPPSRCFFLHHCETWHYCCIVCRFIIVPHFLVLLFIFVLLCLIFYWCYNLTGGCFYWVVIFYGYLFFQIIPCSAQKSATSLKFLGGYFYPGFIWGLYPRGIVCYCWG